MELRLSIDEREDPDEEQEITVDDLPIVINNDVIDSYGETYTVTMNAEGLPVITNS